MPTPKKAPPAKHWKDNIKSKPVKPTHSKGEKKVPPPLISGVRG